ncbi:hypothetical protein SKAU_G00286000 [Synaphobranchus kaupii]|uniref:Uncharacterized protein n=1 Tax=Synaphobranchus kaupii TaxID=118154 RepID=A0A9Q1ING9_SYNKA|nr:hypothetical protein SKAU_G00286000 [Synaphobranchus kaupii]
MASESVGSQELYSPLAELHSLDLSLAAEGVAMLTSADMETPMSWGDCPSSEERPVTEWAKVAVRKRSLSGGSDHHKLLKADHQLTVTGPSEGDYSGVEVGMDMEEGGTIKPLGLGRQGAGGGVYYKLIARVLAARLGVAMPHVVHEGQTCGVEGRAIGCCSVSKFLGRRLVVAGWGQGFFEALPLRRRHVLIFSL